eukprot:TRINITY_DN1704_c0_g1_i1.p1 TRINITY_DN1704_c0_g1~~TRINITY_DN1704_c0_g1_i1.p1  ORF type:complete len:490 (+),score=103.41 TRINITY_DN1704_c0_g1_i1:37-1470(+)
MASSPLLPAHPSPAAIFSSCSRLLQAQAGGNEGPNPHLVLSPCHKSLRAKAKNGSNSSGVGRSLLLLRASGGSTRGDAHAEEENQQKQQSNGGLTQNRAVSSWDAKNAEGKDYLYRLGKEADNLRITVGAREGLIDNVFVGNFLGKDADIVFKYRQKVTRSFEHLQGDFYIAPAFMDTVVTFLAKNYLHDKLNVSVPLILGVWGGKGQGKTFQLELIFKKLGLEPVILSAGELESEWAGEPGRLIRNRYRDASLVIKNKGKMSCLMINDLDAGIGRFAHTQMTVNNQMVVGTLMNLADNPTRVSVGQDWRMADVVNRVPIIVTGNDFSTLWAPLIRDGRMEKFYWQPTREDLINIVHRMYARDNIPKEDVAKIIDTFPNQALDFYGALRARTFDQKVLDWVKEVGGPEKVGSKLARRWRMGEDPPPAPTIDPPKQTLEDLIQAGYELTVQQELVNQMRLSEEYMRTQTGPGVGLNIN